MSKLKNLEEALIEKLNLWATTKNIAVVLVDTFLATMEAEGWDSDDKMKVLETAKDYYNNNFRRSEFIYEVINCEWMDIRINEGYDPLHITTKTKK